MKNLKLFAVIGNPIKHSLSPLIHNHAIAYYNLESYYTRLLLPVDIDAEFLREFVFSSNLCGLNITLPFKEIAINALDSIDTLAQKIGAINTLVKKDSKLYGYNTDAFGFYSCIESLKPKNVLILGAGGSAKSIANILSYNNINFTLANRSKEKLKFFESFCDTCTFSNLDSKKSFDIIVNATSSSTQGVLPLDSKKLESLFENAKLAFDLMYLKDGLTPFCALAKSKNINFLDGKNMLVFQAAFSFIYFHNLNIKEIPNIINVMNKSLGL